MYCKKNQRSIAEKDVRVGVLSVFRNALIIQAKAFVSDGNKLYWSSNGVWQAEYVSPKYFRIEYLQEKRTPKETAPDCVEH